MRFPHKAAIISIALAWGVSLGVAPFALGAIIYVDDDAPDDPWPGNPSGSDPLEDGSAEHPFDAIQEGIDAATDGDEVVVLEGTYRGAGNRGIEFFGKAIVVRGSNGPEHSIIDCQSQDRGFYLHHDETRESVIESLTIRRGMESTGGGVRCQNASPTIRNCIIKDNVTWDSGAGLFFDSGAPIVSNSRIIGNVIDNSYGGGGGILSYYSQPEILNCVIAGNVADVGGGLAIAGQIRTVNCTIVQNRARLGGGIYSEFPYEWEAQDIVNCIFWHNRGLELYTGGIVETPVSYCSVEGGWAGPGNIDADPRIRKADCGLAGDSPCIDAGDPNGDYAEQNDMHGEPRVFGERVDIGADELWDADSDGMADWWEESVFGSTAAGDPQADEDGDGLSNVGEYAASRDPFQAPMTYFVSVTGDDSWDGLAAEWDGEHGPKKKIASALALASMFESDEIVVGNGTYAGLGNRNLDPEGRVVTIRSAGGPATCIVDGLNQARVFVFQSAEGNDTVIRGFTINRGRDESGGGVYCVGADPTIEHCVIIDCVAWGGAGAGIFCNGASPVIRECFIVENYANSGLGGGIACSMDSDPYIVDSQIANNSATWEGGGLFANYFSDPYLERCELSGNGAEEGGGIYCASMCSASLSSCRIVGNNPSGVYCQSHCDVSFAQCDISMNAYRGVYGANSCYVSLIKSVVVGNASSGIRLYDDCELVVLNSVVDANGDAGIMTHGSGVTLRNGIIWDNLSTQLEIGDSYPFDVDISYCAIEGGYDGEGVIDADPLFVDALGPDGVAGTEDDDLHLQALSPCIDTGDPASEFGLEPEPDGGRVNMGAYGNTVEAATKGWLYIDDYGIVQKTRVGRTVFEYEMTITMHNGSDVSASNLVAEVLAMPDNVEVLEGVVLIDSVGAGETVVSDDTFTIVVDRAEVVSPVAISWQVTYARGGVYEQGTFTTLFDPEGPVQPGKPGPDSVFEPSAEAALQRLPGT